jgi:hypothetical protein
MKTVIFVWTANVNNIDTDVSFWGIGDVVRGIISMYQLSTKYGFRLIIDTQLTPISELLKAGKHDYSDYVLSNRDNIPFVYPGKVMDFINNHESNVVLLMTNDVYKDQITEDCKAFVKAVLTPTDEFESCILSGVAGIVHCRTGDQLLVRNGELDDDFYNKIIRTIGVPSDFLLMSDSLILKQRIKREYPAIPMLDTNIGHTGYKHHSSILKDTLMEFLIITRSKQIHSYTVYNWPSGFVKIAHDIYDVPLKIYSL